MFVKSPCSHGFFTFSPSIWPAGRATGTSLAWRAHLRRRDAAVDGAGFGTALEMVYFMENPVKLPWIGYENPVYFMENPVYFMEMDDLGVLPWIGNLHLVVRHGYVDKNENPLQP